MELADIRRTRVRQIIDDDFAKVDAAFAEAIGKAPTVIYRWFTDKLAHRRNIGEKMARHIENKCGKPPLWLDTREQIVHQEVAQYATGKVRLIQGMPSPQSPDTLENRGSDVPREARLLRMYRQLSPTNQRRLELHAELLILEQTPAGADPFDAGGISNLKKKANKKNGQRGAATATPKPRHGKGT